MLSSGTSAFLDCVGAIAPNYSFTTMDRPLLLKKEISFLGKLDILEAEIEPYKDTQSPVVSNTVDMPLRNKLYIHAQQKALFPSMAFSQEQIGDGWLAKTNVADFVKRFTAAERKHLAPVYFIHRQLNKAVDMIKLSSPRLLCRE